MKDVISYIIELFGSFSPITQIVLVVLVGGLIFFGYFFVKNDSFRKSMILLVRKSFRSATTNIHLLSHDLFFKKRYLIEHANHVTFNSENKTKLFRILLEKKIETVIEKAQELVKTIDYKKDKGELFEALYDNMLGMLDKYEKDIENEYKFKYGETKGAKLFYLIYLHEKNGFKVVHEPHVIYITKNIEKNSFSNAFSIKQKIYNYLTQLQIALEQAVTDCGTVCELTNGEIDKVINS